jgi:hypothetical protein
MICLLCKEDVDKNLDDDNITQDDVIYDWDGESADTYAYHLKCWYGAGYGGFKGYE